jgi:hypothetical protein
MEDKYEALTEYAPVWKPVVGHEGHYEVSSHGEIRSLDRCIEQLHASGNSYTRKIKASFLSQAPNGKGYKYAYINGKNRLVHRIVAEAFINNDLSLPQVNHKNGDKTDNRIQNLEWCSNSDNQKHRYDVLGHVGAWSGKSGKDFAFSKPVVAISLLDGTFHNFDCASDAVRHGRAKWQSAVQRACAGKVKQHNGYVWGYV